MGSNRDEELITREEITLIDFLYKDMNLINSFYSQIFGGNLNDLSRSEVSVDETSNSAGLGISVAKASNTSKSGISKEIIENISPHDFKVIKLLEALNLSSKDISCCKSGSIVAISGELIFRSFDSINSILPFISNYNLVPDFNSPLNPNAKGKERNLTMGKLVAEVLKMIPYGLEIEVNTQDDENATCIINEESLTISSNDLLRAYGTSIPDKWTIIGIIDNNPNTVKSSKNPFKTTIDTATEAFASMMLDKHSSIIRPIAIYRHLST